MKIDDWNSLIDFCDRYGIYPKNLDLSELCDESDLGDVVGYMAKDCCWQSIKQMLMDLDWDGPRGATFRVKDKAELADALFEEAKSQVLQQYESRRKDG